MIAALALLLAPLVAQDPFDAGVAQYRAGDYAAATASWRALLGTGLSPDARGTVMKNLGNAAWRDGRPVEAAAWYQAALGSLPRDRGLWHDLEFARRETGLDPFDRGDWRSATWRATHLLTAGESARLALLATVLLAGLLLVEAVRGGRLPKVLAVAATALVLLTATPLVVRALEPQGLDLAVVAADGAPLRTEPRGDLPAVGRLDAGARVRGLDRLLDWVRVEDEGGVRGWVSRAALLNLAP